jgi:SAM-dependent methyltransferase
MDGVADRSEKAVAHIFNSAVACWAVSAAWELGALDSLHEKGTLDIPQFADEHGLDVPSTLGMFRALAAVDIVERHGTIVTSGMYFAEVQRTRSFFHWLMRGSAELFRRMPDVLRTENRVGDYFQRDAAAIAFACREISEFCYDPWFWKAVEGLDQAPTAVADLGCGSGRRVMELADHYPMTRGLGIDIAPGALAVARDDAGKAGLAGRVTFLEADVLTMEGHAEFRGVDLVTCFMMGHDFWPRQRCLDTLEHLRSVFPDMRTLLLGDATRSTGTADRDFGVFTLGFEFAHDMMDTFLPTVAAWESVFAEAGWRVREKYAIDISVGETIFHLEPPGPR